MGRRKKNKETNNNSIILEYWYAEPKRNEKEKPIYLKIPILERKMIKLIQKIIKEKEPAVYYYNKKGTLEYLQYQLKNEDEMKKIVNKLKEKIETDNDKKILLKRG